MINSEKILKKLTLKLINPFFRKKSTHIKKENLGRVLVFRLDNKLGNAILLLPLIQSIKNSIPEIKIDVLYSSNYSQIFDNHPDINSTIIYDQQYLFKNPFRLAVPIPPTPMNASVIRLLGVTPPFFPSTVPGI